METKDPCDMTEQELRERIRQIFGLEKGELEGPSPASRGLLGYLNKRSRDKRQRRYRRQINRGFKGTRIVSEGDSWFQYPVFINDIVDWLAKKEDEFAIFSLGFGGDWLSNMIREGEFRSALATWKPDIFMISGGGNDLLGDGRLGKLLHDYSRVREDNPELYVKDSYYELLDIFKCQFINLFREMKETYPDMYIVCQGYDYAIPSFRLGRQPIQFLTNLFLGNGNWLKRPMLKHKIENVLTQRAIIRVMIDAFNDMLQEIAVDCDNLIYIDCRNLVGEKEWYNELHPKSKAFKRIAELFEKRIREGRND